MIKNILSVVSGYAIFVISSLALFKFSGQGPHTQPATGFMVFTVLYGAAFSFLAGLVTKLLATIRKLSMNYVLFFIIAGFATFSFLKAAGNHWTQLFAIFLFAPVSILGGLFYQKRYNENNSQ